jgi:hypothetical protein
VGAAARTCAGGTRAVERVERILLIPPSSPPLLRHVRHTAFCRETNFESTKLAAARCPGLLTHTKAAGPPASCHACIWELWNELLEGGRARSLASMLSSVARTTVSKQDCIRPGGRAPRGAQHLSASSVCLGSSEVTEVQGRGGASPRTHKWLAVRGPWRGRVVQPWWRGAERPLFLPLPPPAQSQPPQPWPLGKSCLAAASRVSRPDENALLGLLGTLPVPGSQAAATTTDPVRGVSLDPSFLCRLSPSGPADPLPLCPLRPLLAPWCYCCCYRCPAVLKWLGTIRMSPWTTEPWKARRARSSSCITTTPAKLVGTTAGCPSLRASRAEVCLWNANEGWARRATPLLRDVPGSRGRGRTMSAGNCFSTPPSPGGHPGPRLAVHIGWRPQDRSHREFWRMWKAKPVWCTVGSGRLSASRHPLPPDTAGVEPGWARRSRLCPME